MTDEEKKMKNFLSSMPLPMRLALEFGAGVKTGLFDDIIGREETVTHSTSSTPSKPAPKLPEIPLVHKKEYYGDNVAEVTTVVRNQAGMHARPCSLFVSTANKFNSKIQIKAKGKTTDAKSILMIMSMGLVRGTEITISASGSDASEAVKALIERIDLMKNKILKGEIFMFLSGLNPKQQEAFLNLAYTMVYADSKLAEEEKKFFESYKLELDADLSKAHKVDFETELSVFDDCDKKNKTAVFFELYAIALIDEEYPEEEKKLVDIMQRRFEITEAKMQEMRDGLKEFTTAYANLGKIIED